MKAGLGANNSVNKQMGLPWPGIVKMEAGQGIFETHFAQGIY